MKKCTMPTGGNVGTASFAFAVVSSIFGSTSVAVAADCFADLRVGLFTERHFSELDAKTRSKAGDPKIDHMATTALRSTRANVVSISADIKENAVTQARGDGLPVLAYLDVEATSSEIEMQFGKTNMVTVETATRLQFLSSTDGTVLSESSDFGKSAGLDIEHALPGLLEPTLASMAEQAAREACKNGLSSGTVIAEAQGFTQSKPSIEDSALVSEIQHVLTDLGYDVGEPDGIAGGLTRRAIERAESEMRRPTTGEPSEGLLIRLNEKLVTDAQVLLKGLGRIKGEPSGVLNRETRMAIKAIEREQGLHSDGEPDGDLINILEAELNGASVSSETEAEVDPRLRFRIEELLFDLGYLNSPPSGEDSFDLTEAIRQAELKHGLPVDGMPDLSLFRKLQSARRGS